MMTGYDAPTAALLDGVVDVILVGDSVGMVALGHKSTTSVTMSDMEHHTRAVTATATRSLVVADLPFGAYVTVEDALHNAVRLVQRAGAGAVKLEGGQAQVEKVRALAREGIAVVGHIGLTPQTAHMVSGGYTVQGKRPDDALRLVEDARALEDAGAVALVLEMVPDEVAALITASLRIPTIGIGAGPHTTGQVLVFHDSMGFAPAHTAFVPRFARQYARVGTAIAHAVERYASDVRTGAFPSPAHGFPMAPEALVALRTRWENLPSENAADEGDSTGGGPTSRRARRGAWPLPTAEPTAAASRTAPKPGGADTGEPRGGLCPSGLWGAGDSWRLPDRPLRVSVVGAGAIGQLFAARLAGAAATAPALDLTLVARSTPQAERLRRDGVHAEFHGEGVGGEAAESRVVVTVRPVSEAQALVDDSLRGSADVVLVAVKGSDTATAAQLARTLVRSDGAGVVVSLQNGVRPAETLSRIVGDRAHVVASVLSLGAKLHDASPPKSFAGSGAPSGRVEAVISSGPGRIVLGPWTPTTEHGGERTLPAPRSLTPLASLLHDAGFADVAVATAPEELQSTMLEKLLANCVINPFATLLGVRNGDLRTAPESVQRSMRAVAEEVWTVAAARGTPLRARLGGTPSADAGARRLLGREEAMGCVWAVVDATAANTCSMRADVLRGRRTEVRELTGWVVHEGARVGVPTPANAAVLAAVEAVEKALVSG